VRTPADFRLRSSPLQVEDSPDKIRDLIGPGGKKIRSIIEAPASKLTYLEDGTVQHLLHQRSRRRCGLADGPRRHRQPPKSARPISAKSFASRSSRLRRAIPRHRRPLHISESPNIASATVRDRAEARRPGPGKGLSIEGNKVRLFAPKPSSRKPARSSRSSRRRRRRHLLLVRRRLRRRFRLPRITVPN